MGSRLEPLIPPNDLVQRKDAQVTIVTNTISTTDPMKCDSNQADACADTINVPVADIASARSQALLGCGRLFNELHHNKTLLWLTARTNEAPRSQYALPWEPLVSAARSLAVGGSAKKRIEEAVRRLERGWNESYRSEVHFDTLFAANLTAKHRWVVREEVDFDVIVREEVEYACDYIIYGIIELRRELAELMRGDEMLLFELGICLDQLDRPLPVHERLVSEDLITRDRSWDVECWPDRTPVSEGGINGSSCNDEAIDRRSLSEDGSKAARPGDAGPCRGPLRRSLAEISALGVRDPWATLMANDQDVLPKLPLQELSDQRERQQRRRDINRRCEELQVDPEEAADVARKHVRQLMDASGTYLGLCTNGIKVSRSGFDSIVELKQPVLRALFDYFVEKRKTGVDLDDLSDEWEQVGPQRFHEDGSDKRPKRGTVKGHISRLNKHLKPLKVEVRCLDGCRDRALLPLKLESEASS